MYGIHPVTVWYYMYSLYIIVYTQCSFLQFAYFHCLAKGMEAFSADPTALIPDLLVLK